MVRCSAATRGEEKRKTLELSGLVHLLLSIQIVSTAPYRIVLYCIVPYCTDLHPYVLIISNSLYSLYYDIANASPYPFSALPYTVGGKTLREITLKVIDRGAGISKSELSEIFHAYSRVRPEQLQQGVCCLAMPMPMPMPTPSPPLLISYHYDFTLFYFTLLHLTFFYFTILYFTILSLLELS